MAHEIKKCEYVEERGKGQAKGARNEGQRRELGCAFVVYSSGTKGHMQTLMN